MWLEERRGEKTRNRVQASTNACRCQRNKEELARHPETYVGHSKGVAGQPVMRVRRSCTGEASKGCVQSLGLSRSHGMLSR